MIENNQNQGYIYCFSNKILPGLYKIGTTKDSIDKRLRAANNTWVPDLYQIEFAKLVIEPTIKEKKIHKLLTSLDTRYNPAREFFDLSLDQIKLIFDLIDGEYIDIEIEAKKVKKDKKVKKVKKDNNIDMIKYFTDGQLIRHTINKFNSTRIGIFNAKLNAIVHDEITYKTIGAFAKKHHAVTTGRSTANGWDECYCEVNGEWIQAGKLRNLAN